MFSSLAILSLGGVLTACEDGPNQTYSPSPLGAGNNWNNGNSAPSAGNAGASYDGGFNSITPLNLCSADLQRTRWANLLTQPIVPGDPKNNFHPTFGGIDLAGPDWGGVTFQTVEKQLCSGIDVGPAGDGMQVSEGACFGDNCEFLFAYVAATHVVNQVVLNLGYTGACDYTSDPAHGAPHSYHMVIGQQIQKDNKPFEIDWNDGNLAAGTEIFNGLMYTFGGPRGMPGSAYMGPVTNCQPSSCPLTTSGTEVTWSIEALGLRLWFGSMSTQPTASTLVRVDLL
jgi:hypothetical protein